MEPEHVSFPEITAHTTEQSVFQTMFDQATIGMAWLSLDGRFLHANLMCCTMFGLPFDELMGCNFFELAPELRSYRENLQAQRGALCVEHRWEEDGQFYWQEYTLSTIRNDKGQLHALAIMIEDITARKRSEAELAYQHRCQIMLRQIASRANQASTLDDMLQPIIEDICQHLEWPFGCIRLLRPFTKPRHALSSPTYRQVANVLPQFDAALDTFDSIRWMSTPDEFPESLRDTLREYGLQSGFYFPVLYQGQPIAYGLFFSQQKTQQNQNLNDSIEQVSEQLTRVAEREFAARALQSSEQRYRLITDHSVDIILLIDREGNIQYASPSFRKQLDHNPEALIGTSVFALVHPDDLADAAVAFANASVYARATLRYADARGNWHWYDAAGTTINQNDVPYIIAVGRDISEQRAAQEALLAERTLLA